MFRTLLTAVVGAGRGVSGARARGLVFAAVASLALSLTASPASAKTVFPLQGGSGDAGFTDYCPANQYVTGLAGRAGGWVDQIQILCSPILANGTHGPTYYGPTHGGTGGAAQQFSCANDSVATGATLYLDDNIKRIMGVDLACTSQATNRQVTVQFGPGSILEQLKFKFPYPCPNGELAVGFAGRYGKDVNALGLLCDARVVASAPAPVVSMYPIRTTGRGPATPAPAPGTLVCPQGFVFRNASPTDHVCVGFGEQLVAAQENRAAASHVSATDHTYGPNTCVQGYVWRAAFANDAVCVTVQQRADAAHQNQVAPPLIPAP